MTDLAWTHIGPSMLAAFLASTVEFVEALTVILAVGSMRGWRDALAGTAAALCVLLLLVGVLGTTLTRMPLDIIQLTVGALLLLFGLRWLRKAILRASGVIPLHDETAAFERQTKAMGHHGAASGWDKVAFGAAFQITMLEGVEVVFIVIAVGAGGRGLLLSASIGAFAALVLVGMLGVILHRPLSRVPENALKFMVGVLLSAFGTFWVGEGIGAPWPGQDRSILFLVAGFLAIALLAVPLCRSRAAATSRATG
ncbi:TMEM165/GDT1 family protein [Acidisoma cellulosilytica]|uniref:TMEM165/GDT1 family protein n=1 Tax=Acidisoma cellulosilyticum TaxID=2802395 RepID=A0A964E562_9PROT|nr:TMEM165/GDT1 family protein [Acidisoma cellulosilyticum]MCB8881658.1 TMEM165/GDT1 family protein [Acidisoma cellulosilyticum]